MAEGKAVFHLKNLMNFNDSVVKKNVCFALSQIAKHNDFLANTMVEEGIFPEVFHRLDDADNFVKKNAATLIREVVKRSESLASAVVNAKGVEPIVEFIKKSKGQNAINALPAIMSLGFIAA